MTRTSRQGRRSRRPKAPSTLGMHAATWSIQSDRGGPPTEQQRLRYLGSGRRTDVLMKKSRAVDSVEAPNPLWLWRSYQRHRAAQTELPEWILDEFDRIAARLSCLGDEDADGGPGDVRVAGDPEEWRDFVEVVFDPRYEGASPAGREQIRERFSNNPARRRRIESTRPRLTTPGGHAKDRWKARVLDALGFVGNHRGGRRDPIQQWLREREDEMMATYVRIRVDGDREKLTPACAVVAKQFTVSEVRVRRAWKVLARVVRLGDLEAQRAVTTITDRIITDWMMQNCQEI